MLPILPGNAKALITAWCNKSPVLQKVLTWVILRGAKRSVGRERNCDGLRLIDLNHPLSEEYREEYLKLVGLTVQCILKHGTEEQGAGVRNARVIFITELPRPTIAWQHARVVFLDPVWCPRAEELETTLAKAFEKLAPAPTL